MGSNGSDKPVDAKPPGLDVSNGDAPGAPPGCHEFWRSHPRAPRSQGETSVDPRPRNARHQDTFEAAR
jgi:hypothetical protein